MKDGMRFVDCDMHIMEPVDLFDRYLDPQFRDRVTLSVGADGKRKRGLIIVDGQPTTYDVETQQHRKPHHGSRKTETSQPLSGSRLAETALIAALGSALPLLSEVTRATSAVWRHFDDTKDWISNWFRRDLWLFDIWWTDLGNELAWLISVLAAWVWIRRLRQWTTVA